MKKYAGFRKGVAAVAAVSAYGLASAQVSLNSRVSNYDISTGSPSFAGANANYSFTFDGTAVNQGDSTTGTLTVRSGYQNYTLTNTGGMVTTADPVSLNVGIAFPTINLSGETTISYSTPVSSDFGSSFLVSGVSGGLHTLEFDGGGTGFLSAGKPFTLNLTLNGNWTTQGTSTGDLQLLGYNNAWSSPTITFDGTNTHIHMLNSNFDGTSTSGPNLDFKLYGSSVPDPAVYLTFGLGLACLGRKRFRLRRAPL